MNRQVSKKMRTHRSTGLLALVVALVLCAGLMWATGAVVFAQDSYNYTVLEGDSWDSVATRTGVSVAELQAANPEAAARESGWLLVGETLAIPVASTPTQPQRTHRVQAGESWNSIAAEYGISVSLLRAANPQAVRSGNVLFRGEELIIPPTGSRATAPQPTSAATSIPVAPATAASTEVAEEETPTPAAEEEMSAPETETMTETVEATTTATVEASAEVTATASMTDSAAMTATTEMTTSEGITTATGDASSEAMVEPAFDLPACPERFADYSLLMTELSNSVGPEGLDAVLAFLTACQALVTDGVMLTDLNGDGSDDLVVVYQNPSEDQIFVEGDLVIFNSIDSGYVLGYRARAAGEVRLLTVEDINLDELPDVAWVDTTCGASTCFDTVNVRSWDGTTWADWTEGTITMAYAEITLADVLEEGLGEEISLEGGIYGSVGAGPQRSRSEIWASVDGAPYKLVEKSYMQTECLYHTVLDANRAFLDAPTNGFAAAIELYTQAAEDESLIKCWVRNDELAELRSFSHFRLALIAAYSDDSATATTQIATLSAQYPGSIYAEVGELWLESYEASGDAALACEDVTAFAEEDSAAWEMLADYGYTNPSFEAVDVCPILDLSALATPEAEEEATE